MSKEEFDDGYYDEELEREKFDTYARPPLGTVEGDEEVEDEKGS